VKVGDAFRLAVPTGTYHTWNGTPLEGIPIEPDEQIGFDWQTRRTGIGEQLEYAVSGLGTEIARRVR
jgi:carboxyl-terminal processing protease